MLDTTTRTGAQASTATGRSVPFAGHSDETLLVLVAAGHRQAFAEVYDRFAPQVYGVARRVVVDPSMAEEVTQEVLLGVWATAKSFDGERGSARGWIMTIAHRRAVDVVRSEQASRNRSERVAAASVDRPFDEVADLAVARVAASAQGRELHRALLSLSDVQRAAVELAYFKGLTYREVARTLGVPLGTAKTRIRDGLIRLAQQLDRAPAA